MTEASPYMLERLLKQIESSRSILLEITQTERENDRETKIDEYKEKLDQSLKRFEEITKKYSEDNETKKIFEGLLNFYEERSTSDLTNETEKLDKTIHDLKHIIEWRIVQGASGRTLGKKSFRSLRGSTEKRG